MAKRDYDARRAIYPGGPTWGDLDEVVTKRATAVSASVQDQIRRGVADAYITGLQHAVYAAQRERNLNPRSGLKVAAAIERMLEDARTALGR